MIYSDYLEWLKIFQGRKFVEFDCFSKKRKYRHIIVDNYNVHKGNLEPYHEIYLFKTYCLREGNIISIKNFCRCRNNMRNMVITMENNLHDMLKLICIRICRI